MNDQGIRIHERHIPINNAKCELGMFMLELQKKHNLTTVEQLAILNEEQASLIRMAIRSEREQE